MTTTDESTTIQPALQPPGVPVAGWERPAWAEEFGLDGTSVTWRRTGRRVPLVDLEAPGGGPAEMIPEPVALIRNDDLHIDEGATVRVESEPPVVFLDIEELPVSQARVLAEALIELADYAEGVSSA
ncbi:MAG: hypothetical protein QOF30_717 [Acidimicrobiaceae bacterium]|jgi:hypothetical protein|nr:hypothetical protein [Acidimicrobiaceae bacterium]